MERGEEQGSQNYKRGAFLSLSFYSLSSSLSLSLYSLSLFDFCALREKTRSKSLSCQKKETQKLASAALFIAAAATAAAPSGRRRGPLLLLRRALPQRPAHLGVLPSHQLEDGVPHRVASRAKRRRRRRRSVSFLFRRLRLCLPPLLPSLRSFYTLRSPVSPSLFSPPSP